MQKRNDVGEAFVTLPESTLLGLLKRAYDAGTLGLTEDGATDFGRRAERLDRLVADARRAVGLA